jgi:hypothetical protein
MTATVALRERILAFVAYFNQTAKPFRFWRARVEKSGLSCFDAFLSLLDTWLDLIANYFINRQSSGFVEGLNNKLKVLKRRCYRLRNVVRLFQRLTLDLEGYRRFSPWRAATFSAVHGYS